MSWNRLPYVLPYLVKLLLEPLVNGLSVDGKNQSRPVGRVFHHLETCLFGREFPLVFFRIEFTCILQRLATDERCCLSFIEPDKEAQFFHAQHFTQVGKPCRRLCDYRFQRLLLYGAVGYKVFPINTLAAKREEDLSGNGAAARPFSRRKAPCLLCLCKRE